MNIWLRNVLQVDKIMKLWEGREDEIITTLHAKYLHSAPETTAADDNEAGDDDEDDENSSAAAKKKKTRKAD